MKYLFFTLFLSLSFASIAQTERMETDRPDQTESPFLTPEKWIQLEMGMNYQVNSRGDGYKFSEYLHPTLLSKYGISKNVELRLITTVKTEIEDIRFADKASITGIEPVEIGGKIRMWEEKKGLPKTSLIFHFGIPQLASKKFKYNKVAPNFRFVMQNTLSEKVGLGYNIGAEWDGYSNTPTWIYTFAPGFNLGRKGYCYIETFGFISKETHAQHSIDGGFAYYLNNNIKLDISSGFGISKEAPPFYIAIGASVRFDTKN